MTGDVLTPAKLNVHGHVRIWRVTDTEKQLIGEQPNQIQYSWGAIAARQIGFRPQPDRLNYNISALYIEFENVATAETEIATAPFARDLGISYYNSLIDSSVRDFLRIPLTI